LRTQLNSVGRLSLAAGLSACFALALTTSAGAQTGGSAPATEPTSSPTPTTPTTIHTVPGTRAKLNKKGKAIPPAEAPIAVQHAIIAANQIRKRPYRWGGGHASFYDTGYDCSGAVSYLLYAAGLLDAPMPSGPFMTWGEPGRGQWITTFANKGHMYAVVAGLRWDTSSAGDTRSSGKGPRWRAKKRSPKGYAVRHYPGY
jgi:hypothetical protein